MAETDEIRPPATQEAKEPAAVNGPGAVLRNEREKKGLTLDQVASITKLRAKIVEALENENWGDLPPSVFVRGFIRSYARVLGLDGKELLRLYDRVAPSQAVTGKPVEVRHRSYKGRFVLAVILVLIVGFLAYLLLEHISPPGELIIQKGRTVPESGKEKSDAALTSGAALTPDQAKGGGEGTSSAGQGASSAGQGTSSAGQGTSSPGQGTSSAGQGTSSPGEGTASVPAAVSPPEVERTKGVSAPVGTQTVSPSSIAETGAGAVSPETYELKGIVLDETWVRIQIDNGEPKEYIFQPGARPQWKAKEGFSVTVGNAAGIELELNGTKLKSLGKSGKVVKINLPTAFKPTRTED